MTDFGPEYFIPQPWVQYDGDGRITANGCEGQALAARRVPPSGNSILMTDKMYSFDVAQNYYVDTSTAIKIVKPRPAYQQPSASSGSSSSSNGQTIGASTALQLDVRQEVVLPGIPKCTVYYTGPTSGSLPHAGGDLSLGFALPGTYQVSFEAFPLQKTVIPITVLPQAIIDPVNSNTPTANKSVKV